MSEIKAGSLRKNMYISFKGHPHKVVKTDFMSPGKGSAFMRVKLRNFETGNSVDFTYKSNESITQIDVTNQQLQYLYHDNMSVVFMNTRSYEQVSVPIEFAEDSLQLLTPDVQVYVLFNDEIPIGISLPPKVTLKVTDAIEAVAGNTVGQARKEVTLETGLVVQAPLFVKKGDSLVIDTETKTYISRG
ncbi:MAG: elongation factor P [Microgenomates group bacterium]